MQTYRPDIDGMRAIAVGAVVLNHSHAPHFTGGFLGVDVFFVISGYLITGLLLGDGAQARSLATFYERRVRRILPALIVVLLASTGAALALYAPTELVAFAKSLAAATLFVANQYFQTGTSYFHPGPTEPLLHLWSLSIEEQFYLVYPLLLWGLRRYAPKLVDPVLVATLLLALAAPARPLPS